MKWEAAESQGAQKGPSTVKFAQGPVTDSGLVLGASSFNTCHGKQNAFGQGQTDLDAIVMFVEAQLPENRSISMSINKRRSRPIMEVCWWLL